MALIPGNTFQFQRAADEFVLPSDHLTLILVHWMNLTSYCNMQVPGMQRRVAFKSLTSGLRCCHLKYIHLILRERLLWLLHTFYNIQMIDLRLFRKRNEELWFCGSLLSEIIDFVLPNNLDLLSCPYVVPLLGGAEGPCSCCIVLLRQRLCRSRWIKLL